MRKKLVMIIFWLLVIFILSSDSNSSYHSKYLLKQMIDMPSYEILNFIIRKIAHILEFFVLGMLLFSLFKNFEIKRIHFLILPCLFTLNLAFFDEIHQLFIPGRTGTMKDVLYDFLGILLSFFYIQHSTKIRPIWTIIREGDHI